MTTDQWIALATPVIAFLIPTAGAVLALVVSGIMERLRAWLEAHNHAQASKIVADASVRMQAAMQNAAGQIALEVQQGTLNLNDVLAVHRRIIELGDGVVKKLPDAVRTLNPSPSSIVEGIRGKITSALPVPDPVPLPSAAPTSTRPSEPPAGDLSSGSFQARAAIVVGRLMRDLGLERFQASGIVGNLGQESGLMAINEMRPVSGRGGWGWAQWTGPRRIEMETWCKAQGLAVTDPEANYGFLVHELQTSERAALEALRQTTSLEDATRVFEEKYERAGVVALARRQTYAEQAMAA